MLCSIYGAGDRTFVDEKGKWAPQQATAQCFHRKGRVPQAEKQNLAGIPIYNFESKTSNEKFLWNAWK